MKAYKLLTLKKDGLCYPLFIGKQTPTMFGMWLQSECIPTKGFKERQGWHCCALPIAPHLKERLATGEVRVWVECDIINYREKVRPASQGGLWFIADKIRINRVLSDAEVMELRKAVAV